MAIEKQTSSEVIARRAAAAGLAITAGGIGFGIGHEVGENNASSPPDIESAPGISAERISDEKAQELVDQMYPAESVIGSFSIPDNSVSVYDSAVAVVQDHIGIEAYNGNKEAINNILLPTSKKVSLLQPGDERAVVETDLDPEANNGYEYIVVKMDHLVHQLAEGELLESPTTDTDN